MKRLPKMIALFAGTAAIAVFGLGSVFADSPGQLTGGSQVYEAKNITQNGSYADSVSTVCGDTVQYSTMLHNAGSGALTNIVVKASLTGGTVTATPAEGASYGTSDSVSVSLPSGGSLTYQSGTTVLYDQNGAVLQNLPDGITGSGVNIGNMNGSTLEYLNFRAQVSCAAPPPATFTATATATATANASATATCPPDQGGASATSSASGSATATASGTSSVSQADAYQIAYNKALQAATPSAQANAEANAKAKATASVKCTSATVTNVTAGAVTKTLPNTGAGDVLGIFTGTSAAGTALHYVVTRRRK